MRYLKGITEWIWLNFKSKKDIDIDIISTAIIGDMHSLPYTTTLGTWLGQINCIPMNHKTDDQIKKHLMDLFASQNYDIKIPPGSERVHESNPEKLELFNQIKKSFNHHYVYDDKNMLMSSGRLEYLHILLSADLKFYRDLTTNFDPQWKQIKRLHINEH
jgi:hypothetical protein